MHRTCTEDAASAQVHTLDAARWLSSRRCVAQGSGRSIIAPWSYMLLILTWYMLANSHTHYRNIAPAFACLLFPPLPPHICWHSYFTLCAQQQRTCMHTAPSQNPIAPAVTAHTHAERDRQREHTHARYSNTATAQMQPCCPRIAIYTQIQVHTRTHTRRRRVW